MGSINYWLSTPVHHKVITLCCRSNCHLNVTTEGRDSAWCIKDYIKYLKGGRDIVFIGKYFHVNELQTW